jgi:hypothetical protein
VAAKLCQSQDAISDYDGIAWQWKLPNIMIYGEQYPARISGRNHQETAKIQVPANGHDLHTHRGHGTLPHLRV